MAGKLAGKVAVVTGASKGIGAAIALQLAAEGAAVVVNYASSKQGADAVVNHIVRGGGKAIAVQADVASEADVVRLFQQTQQTFGKLDILVNNAGIYQFMPIAEVTPELFHKQFNLNVLGLLLASREAAKLFGDRGGNIVNISSVVAKLAVSGGAIYCATKAAVDAITRCLAAELGPRNIRVNAVNPGMVETEGTTSAGITAVESDFKKAVLSQTPLGRIGQVSDIAPLVLFLASDDSSWITGESHYASGGYR